MSLASLFPYQCRRNERSLVGLLLEALRMPYVRLLLGCFTHIPFMWLGITDVDRSESSLISTHEDEIVQRKYKIVWNDSKFNRGPR